MRINHIKNVENFMKLVNDECMGDVFLVTDEGDYLNLKSKLTQYVMMSKAFGAETNLGTIEIRASQRDIIKIAEYLVSE